MGEHPNRINCFRCRHCQAVPDNLFVTRCNHPKSLEKVVDIVFDNCTLADPRPMRNAAEPRGDLIRARNELTNIFLRAYYETRPIAWMTWALLREPTTLSAYARQLGLRRPHWRRREARRR